MQKYWSGLPFPSPRDLPDPEIEPMFPALAGGFFIPESPGKHSIYYYTLTLKMLSTEENSKYYRNECNDEETGK